MRKKLILVEGLYKTKHPLYLVHKGMLARCYFPNHKHYKYYGGRGIKVVKRWRGHLGFRHFAEDMGVRPKGYTLERINNNGWYTPKNCKWASMTTQSINKRLGSDNTSGYVGIHLYKATGKWSVYIDVNRQRKHLGYYSNLHDAIEVRRRAEEVRLTKVK